MSVTVERGPFEHIDSTLRRFSKAISRDHLVAELREREAYVPKSAKRKAKSRRAQIRRAKFA